MMPNLIMIILLLGIRMRSGPCANIIMHMCINVAHCPAVRVHVDIPDCDGHVHTS